MTDLDEKLERAQADGKITVHDADEVRRFADFLVDAVPVPPFSKEYASAISWRRHYPEDYAAAIAERDRARGLDKGIDPA